jgi:hypothetical protein
MRPQAPCAHGCTWPAEPAAAVAPDPWNVNLRAAPQMREYRALAPVPGLDFLATNVELVGRTRG